MTATESLNISEVDRSICIDNINDHVDIDHNLSFEDLISKYGLKSMFHSSTAGTRNTDSSPITTCQKCDDQISIQPIKETNSLSSPQDTILMTNDPSIVIENLWNYLDQECHSANEWYNEVVFVDQLMWPIIYQ